MGRKRGGGREEERGADKRGSGPQGQSNSLSPTVKERREEKKRQRGVRGVRRVRGVRGRGRGEVTSRL